MQTCDLLFNKLGSRKRIQQLAVFWRVFFPSVISLFLVLAYKQKKKDTHPNTYKGLRVLCSIQILLAIAVSKLQTRSSFQSRVVNTDNFRSNEYPSAAGGISVGKQCQGQKLTPERNNRLNDRRVAESYSQQSFSTNSDAIMLELWPTLLFTEQTYVIGKENSQN